MLRTNAQTVFGKDRLWLFHCISTARRGLCRSRPAKCGAKSWSPDDSAWPSMRMHDQGISRILELKTIVADPFCIATYSEMHKYLLVLPLSKYLQASKRHPTSLGSTSTWRSLHYSEAFLWFWDILTQLVVSLPAYMSTFFEFVRSFHINYLPFRSLSNLLPHIPL